VGIFAALSGEPKGDILRRFGGQNFSAFKAALVEIAVESLAPIGAEMKRLLEDPGHLEAVLNDGAARARVIAAKTMLDVKDILGFVR